jgi:hypothetical protein
VEDGDATVQDDSDSGAFPLGNRPAKPFEHGLDVRPANVRPDGVGEDGGQKAFLLAHVRNSIVI